ncbi:hypothetical protein [Stutzerimonas stutzeri]|uniref:Uncharacterized protein n=1 Tax=Stutzerimonas stutzeri TaxID=316 RepID=A0AA40RUM3_STUST|nr:hypothetical protein [Stutzerimonas stutzeri]MBA1305987.1 hypothetical protein [Stutzerimonas stutzeri]
MSSDEKKKSGLGNFLGQLQEGVSRLNNKRPDSEMRANEPKVDDAGAVEESLLQNQERDPDVEPDDGPLLLDAQATDVEAPKKAKGPMSRKKGLLLVGVLVVAAVIYQNSGRTPVELATEGATAEAVVDDEPLDSQLDDWNPLGVPSTEKQAEATQDDAVGQTLTELQLNGPLQVSPGVPGSVELPLTNFDADPFSPQTEADYSAATTPTQPAGEASPFDLTVTSATAPFGSAAEAPAAGATQVPEANPPSEKGDAILARAASDNPDSKQLPSSEGIGETEIAELKAKLALQEKAIADLNAKLQDVASSTTAPKPKPVSSNASPKPAPATASRPVAKAGPRPKICVKAVAPPARNCSTCVAHAFLVKANHEEDMVGQGDFIAGYRVSITGDRLDLQNSAGDVVHKFWSQPNGCPAI